MTQAEAIEILKMGCNVFLTGAAGSGKTFLLNKYIRFLKACRAEVGITASTGIAATHMNGRTIHSWSGIGIRDRLEKRDIRALMDNHKLVKRLENADVLVIDEISMLHAHQLDFVDKICRAMRDDSRPFGGIQVVLCGDFFQLPPVARGGERARPVYLSDAWQKMNIKICYLEEQHRQADDGFLDILNNIRKNCVSQENIGALAARINKEDCGDICTKLYTHNADVDAINNSELQKLKGDPAEYPMTWGGRPLLVDTLKKSCLAPEKLFLKKGAAVMFVKNNFEAGYVNGTLGVVVDFDEGIPIVKKRNGEKILVLPETWSIDEDGRILARIEQLPLRLAWAITVHKSQGMSLDAAEIDLSKCFEYGMGYVALSRVRTLSGIRLLGWNDAALMVNPEIIEADKKFWEMSEAETAGFAQVSAEDIKKKQKNFIETFLPPEIDFDDIDKLVVASPAVFDKKEPREPNYLKTKKFILEKLPLAVIAEKIGFKPETIIRHIEKLQEEDGKVDIEYLKPAQEHLEKIFAAFAASADGRLSPVYEFLGGKYSYLEIKLAKLFIDKK